MRGKIQNLIDENVITIDLLNKNYEIYDCSKVHHANHHNPPQYYSANPRPSNLQAEGPHNECAYMPKKPKTKRIFSKTTFLKRLFL